MRPFLLNLCLIGVLTLCSCTSYRETMLMDWATDQSLKPLSMEALTGRYENLSRSSTWRPRHLWTMVTNKPSGDDEVIALTVADGELILRRESSGETVSLDLPKKPDTLWYVDSGVHHSVSKGPAFPLLWGWSQDDFAFGQDASGALCMNWVPGVTVMVGPVPTINGGGGPGGRYVFARLAEP